MALQHQRSVPEVLHDIVENLQEIIRSEFRLASTEIKEEAARTVTPMATIGAGIILAIYALGFLLLAIVYALITVVAPWLAALLVAALVGVPSIVLINQGRERLSHVHPMPKRMMASMNENVNWAKNRISSNAKSEMEASTPRDSPVRPKIPDLLGDEPNSGACTARSFD
ncbi:MAG TPA: phage holin family protein [Candidatus Acidoferrum sp.]|nr:phage holin family protein [Candidatus Acidoferrum sp.]